MFYPIGITKIFTPIEDKQKSVEKIEKTTFSRIYYHHDQPFIPADKPKETFTYNRTENSKLFLEFLYRCGFHPCDQRIIELGSGVRNSMAQFIRRPQIQILNNFVLENELRKEYLKGNNGTLPSSSTLIAQNYDVVISANYSKDLLNIDNYPFKEVYIGFCEHSKDYYAYKKKLLYDELYKALGHKNYRMIEEEEKGYKYQLIKKR